MIRTISFASILLAACATQAPSGSIAPGTDELAGETGDGDAAKADAAHDTFGYLAIHKNADPGNPLYGAAYNMTRTNRTTVMCMDNQYHASCDFHAIVWGSLPQRSIDKLEAALDAELAGTKTGTQVIVKGAFKSYVDFSAFVPTEVWIAQLDGGSDDGTFVQVFDRGIRCITAPCPTFVEMKLNSTKTANIEGVDWNGVSDDVQNRAYTATTSTGVIVVGDRETKSEVSFVDTMRSANQVYLPVK